MTQNAEHFATAEPADDVWVVTRNGTEIARSSSVMLVKESFGGRSLDPVPYFPREDVAAALVGPSGHATTCPVKGEASYYSVEGDPETENGIWSYATPISPLESVTDHVAFYGDRFTVSPAA